MIGKSLAHYQVLEKIGEGGMGQVYRARDTTLDRDVALKVLPPHFLQSPERLARFEREAKVLASLNHPGIAAIYGFHHEGDVHFLVMELASGADLAERLGRGPIPMDEALPMAAQIAEALEYAHEQNIVHRDLKPANIKAQDGRVKVLDFGLAKAFLADSGGGDPATTPSLLPTVTTGGTREGVVLGTAAYMSPEQARGHTVDRRADIWAFGCVLYEMLTGRRLFLGDTVSDTIAAVLRADLDLSALPEETPPAVRFLLERCLDRDRNTRLRDIGEARIALSDPNASMAMRVIASDSSAAAAPPRRSFRVLALWLAGALVLGLALGHYGWRRDKPDEVPRYAFEVGDPDGKIEVASLALSPDGRNLVFSRRLPGGSRVLVMRALDELGLRELPGTAGAFDPFWSPDGKEIGYFVQHELYRLALDGTAPRKVADLLTAPLGGTWNADGVILFGSEEGPIFRVNDSGGTIDSLTSLDRKWEMAHVWPAFLPDGKHFVFLADATSDEGHRIRVGSLDGEETKIIRKNTRSAILVDPEGYLLINENQQVLSLPFDFNSRELTGTPRLVANEIQSMGDHHRATFTISKNGVFACRRGSDLGNLVQQALDGTVLKVVSGEENFRNPVLSPDGAKAAFELIGETGKPVIWVEDLARGARTQISKREASADSPTWSPDGEYLYFGSDAGNKGWHLYRKNVFQGGPPETLTLPGDYDYVNVLDCSNDGTALLVAYGEGGATLHLYLGAIGPDSLSWSRWSDPPGVQGYGRISPDSKWIAYQSNESGQDEIYVARLKGGPSSERYLVSVNGGMDPAWSPDGSRVFYRTASNELVEAAVTASGPGLAVGTPEPLFELVVPPATYVRNAYDFFPDGKSMLVWSAADNDDALIQVQTDWRP